MWNLINSAKSILNNLCSSDKQLLHAQLHSCSWLVVCVFAVCYQAPSVEVKMAWLTEIRKILTNQRLAQGSYFVGHCLSMSTLGLFCGFHCDFFFIISFDFFFCFWCLTKAPCDAVHSGSNHSFFSTTFLCLSWWCWCCLPILSPLPFPLSCLSQMKVTPVWWQRV